MELARSHPSRLKTRFCHGVLHREAPSPPLKSATVSSLNGVSRLRNQGQI